MHDGAVRDETAVSGTLPHESHLRINDELRAYCDDTEVEIGALEQLSGKPASWSAH